MATKEEKLAKQEANKAKMEGQLRDWSTQLDDLVAGCVAAGAQSNDEYRLRLEDLRARHTAVQTRLNALSDPSQEHGSWGAFRSDIKEDWSGLTAGFEDLTR